MNADIGTLFVVATPIGNLSDMSPRAREILSSVKMLLAEDTRSFRRLGIELRSDAVLLSYFDHNESKRIPIVIETLQSGASVALVSEAGTPTVSDPGYRVIRACREQGLPVSPIPGPSAMLAALSVSGLPSDRFAFEGFLPVKDGKRRAALSSAIVRGITTIFYESPHRIRKTLDVLAELCPECRVFLARELTKRYEQTVYGSASFVRRWLNESDQVRGEFVLIFSPQDTSSGSAESDESESEFISSESEKRERAENS
jgi:16S rRNA (cytidine1402-2'-O)-methyltransferase